MDPCTVAAVAGGFVAGAVLAPLVVPAVGFGAAVGAGVKVAGAVGGYFFSSACP